MLEDAIQLHRAGRLDEAETAYRQLLAAKPDNAVVMHMLAIVRGQRGDLPEAYRLVRRSIELEPLRATAHHTLGEMYLAESRLDEAHAAYDEARLLDPNLAGAHAGLGQVALERGDINLAEGHFKAALRANGNDPQALAGIGNIAYARGDSKQALALLTQAAQGAPDDPRIQTCYARAMLDQGMLEFATRALENALTLRSNYTPAQILRADVHMRQGEYAAAVRIFQSLLARGEESATAHNGLGDVALARGMYANSIAEYDQALRLQPNRESAAISRANALARNGNAARAIADLQRYRKANPDNARFAVGLARLLELTGQHDEALSAWAEARARWPENPDLLAQYALALDLVGRSDDAAQLADRNATSSHPILSLLRARTALVAGYVEATLQHLDAVKSDDNGASADLMVDCERLRGLAYDHLQRWTDAVAAFSAAQRGAGQPLPALPALDTARIEALRVLAASAAPAPIADAPVFLCGLPGSGVGKIAGVLADVPGWEPRAGRFASAPDVIATAFDLDRPDDAALAELTSVANKYRRAQRRAGVTPAATVFDRIPVLDARAIPLLMRAFPGAKLVVVRRALDDALLNWLGFGWVPRLRFDGATEAARWLARASAHLALASELMPSCVVDADDFLATPDAPARQALAAFLGVGALPDGAHAVARRQGRGGLPTAFPPGHATHYRDALADAFQLLTATG